MENSQKPKLRLLPFGGLGEIGLNMMVISWGRDAFIIDCGLMFPDDSMPGVDFVIPDLDWVLEFDWNILGIIITHAHEDHIGALPFVLKKAPAPIFSTALTMGFIEYKLQEYELLETSERNVISPGQPISIGPFKIECLRMCHSVPDAIGLAIETPEGVIIHSGDFKLDPTPIDGRLCDLEKIGYLGSQGVLVLLSDSTNVENRKETRSESIIKPAFEEIFKTSPGRILIATFSSNIHRIQQALSLAKVFRRKVALVGRSMVSNVKIASELGYLDIPSDTLVDMKDIDDIAEDQLAILSTGSQGEPMSALALMASSRHKYLKVKEGDTIIFSSRFIPGNEKAINQLINGFCRLGANVMYEKIADVHVSGHASENELRSLLRLAKPRYFIPVHGEYRHLQRHARIAVEEGVDKENVMVAQNGDLIRISRDGIELETVFDIGRVFVHGKGVGDIGHDVLKERRTLSEVGIVIATIVVSEETGAMVKEPQLHSRGVTFQDVETELLEGARNAVIERLKELAPKTMPDWEVAREEVRLAVRRHVNRTLGRKPLVQTIIVTV
ncbi:MAG: ribonuclease J [Desulfomonilaceae bacterium]